jgi:cell division septal protein FtsQ
MLKLTNTRRMARKRREKGKRSLLVCVLPAPIAALVVIGLYTVLFTGVFSVREVRLFGSGDLSIDTLGTATADMIGSNLFTISLSKVGKRLRGFPEIRDVEFRRRLFHRIDCYIIEREPVAVVAAGLMYEVGEDGVIIRDGGRCGTDIDLPVVTGIARDVFESARGKRELKEAVTVLQLLKSFGFSPAEHLSEIHCERGEIMLVWMKTGTIVRLGQGDYENKLRKFRAVYPSLEEEGSFPELIDLRFDRQVVVR